MVSEKLKKYLERNNSKRPRKNFEVSFKDSEKEFKLELSKELWKDFQNDVMNFWTKSEEEDFFEKIHKEESCN